MQILTPSGEVFWPAVFKPSKPMEGAANKDPQYQLTIGWSHDREKELKKLKDAIVEVATAKFGKKAAAMLEKGQLKNPLRDGDDSDQDYLEGLYYLTARSSDRPDVVDEDLDDIIDSKEFYGGAEARMDIWLYAFDKAGNRGVAAILNNVQKTGEGERKGGRRSAADAFGGEGGGSKKRSRRDEDEDEDDRPTRSKKRRRDDDDLM